MRPTRHRALGVGTVCLAAVLQACFGIGAVAQDSVTPINPPAAKTAPKGAPTELAVTDRGTVRMHVADMPLADVLQLLSLESRRNIVASPNVTGSVTANLYDVSFVEALEAILMSNGAGYRTIGNFVYVYTNEELDRLEADTRLPLVTQVYYLNYLAAADAKTYIEAMVGDDGSVNTAPVAAKGLASESEDGGGQSSAGQDFVIVTARPSRHHEIKKVLDKVDVRPRQVLVEASILRAQLTEDNALGIDFTLVGGVDLELLGAASNGIADIALGALPQSRLEQFNAAATTNVSGNLTDNGITIGIIKDQVAIFIKALEEVTDITVLANPKLLTLNKQKAQVIVGRRDGFFTTTVTQTQAIQTVQFLETGTQLIFRPFIGNDDHIRVELHPEDSVGFVNAQGLPSEQTTEVTTNVIVRNGETILIGGLFREVTTSARAQVPGLGSLPGLGALFRSDSDTTDREEVIILLTVHIIDNEDAYAKASQAASEDLDRVRVGSRAGLMSSGRERIAQSHYRKAVAALSAGRTDKALWHLNLVLHNQPRFIPAIRLKEQILGKRAWDASGSGGRAFLNEVMMRERGRAVPLFISPEPITTSPAEPSTPANGS